MRLAAAALAIVMLAAPASAQAPLALEGSAAPSPWQRYPGWNKTRWGTAANVTPEFCKDIGL